MNWKDKTLADLWFKNYITDIKASLRADRRQIKHTFLAGIFRKDAQRHLEEAKKAKQLHDRLRHLAVFDAKMYELFSVEPLPKVTRKSLGLE